MNDVKQHYLFKRTTAENNISTNHEHCFICSEDTAWDEVTLLELLNIHSSDIVDRFHDFIEDRADYLEENIDDN